MGRAPGNWCLYPEAEELKRLIEKIEPIKEKPSQPILSHPSIYFSGKVFKPLLLVEDLLQNHELFYDGHTFFKYGNKGVWERTYEEDIEKIVINMLLYESRAAYIYDAMKILKAKCFVSPRNTTNDLMLLNIQNGMLDLKNKKLLPHDKKYYSTVQLPVNYDPNAKAPRFMKFLSEIFSDEPEKTKTVQQFIGYTLYPENIFEKALFFIGHGANGKTTLINAIENLFGFANVSHLELHQLAQRFMLINLKDKMLNTCADIDTRKKTDLNIFKLITSRDTIQSDVKFKKRVVAFKPRCKCIFAMNSTPAIQDTSYGLSRRLILIEFKRQFKESERDVYLDLKLKQEKAGILNWALQGLDEALKNNLIYECETVKAEKDSFLTEIDNVKMFVEETCMTGSTLKIRKTDLFTNYLQFCEASSLFPLKRPAFYKQLYQLIPGLDEFKEKSGPYYFVGVDVITEEKMVSGNHYK